MSHRKTSPAGISLIQRFEGLRLTAYRCEAGVLTIGWGHTGRDVVEGLTINRARAEQLLIQDLSRFEVGVERLAPGLAQHRFDALVSFAFNLGLTALQGSGLLRRIQAGDFEGAGAEFPKWVFAGGKRSEGLAKRRGIERLLFEGGLGGRVA